MIAIGPIAREVTRRGGVPGLRHEAHGRAVGPGRARITNGPVIAGRSVGGHRGRRLER